MIFARAFSVLSCSESEHSTPALGEAGPDLRSRARGERRVCSGKEGAKVLARVDGRASACVRGVRRALGRSGVRGTGRAGVRGGMGVRGLRGRDNGRVQEARGGPRARAGRPGRAWCARAASRTALWSGSTVPSGDALCPHGAYRDSATGWRAGVRACIRVEL